MQHTGAPRIEARPSHRGQAPAHAIETLGSETVFEDQKQIGYELLVKSGTLKQALYELYVMSVR